VERLSELHELLHDAERHEVIPKLREEIRRKSDDKGCLQALQPDARYRNRRDRHMTGGPGFWSEQRNTTSSTIRRSVRPTLGEGESGQEFDPETIQKMADAFRRGEGRMRNLV
jgi:hypothetical protein